MRDDLLHQIKAYFPTPEFGRSHTDLFRYHSTVYKKGTLLLSLQVRLPEPSKISYWNHPVFESTLRKLLPLDQHISKSPLPQKGASQHLSKNSEHLKSFPITRQAADQRIGARFLASQLCRISGNERANVLLPALFLPIKTVIGNNSISCGIKIERRLSIFRVFKLERMR